MSLNRLKLLGKLRITNVIVVKVSNPDAYAMFHFACAKIMQQWAPLLVFFEIFGDMFGEKNVTGVAASHHPLRHVDSSAGNVCALVHVDDPADGSAVHAHSQGQIEMRF